MTSCTIIISHYESVPFLKAAIRQIRKHHNTSIRQKILVADQSSKETYLELEKLYEYDGDVSIVWMQLQLWSGYGVDYLMRYGNIETDYVAEIHSDSFPISDQWLSLPIKLIEEYGFSFVGQLQFINSKENLASIYPPNPFFAMAQCFNVAKTETYKEMSLEAGFTRFHNRPQSGLTFKNNDWDKWAAADYQARGSDDDVVAFWWQDQYKTDDKLGLAITGFVSPAYGRIIDDIVFHFCSCREGLNGSLGKEYNEYVRRINENYDDALIDEMVSLAKKNRPPEMEILNRNFWNGKTKQHSPPSEELNKRIEELKK